MPDLGCFAECAVRALSVNTPSWERAYSCPPNRSLARQTWKARASFTVAGEFTLMRTGMSALQEGRLAQQTRSRRRRLPSIGRLKFLDRFQVQQSLAVCIQIRIRQQRRILFGFEQFLTAFADDPATAVGIDDHDFKLRHARAEQRNDFPHIAVPKRVTLRPRHKLRLVGLRIAVVN